MTGEERRMKILRKLQETDTPLSGTALAKAFHVSRQIIVGDIATDGTMVIATRSRDTKYVVDVYNSAFNRTMSIYKENYVLGVAISPDGEYILYGVSYTSVKDNRSCRNLYICKLDGSENQLITESGKSLNNARWSADGKRVILGGLDVKNRGDGG